MISPSWAYLPEYPIANKKNQMIQTAILHALKKYDTVWQHNESNKDAVKNWN